ncbi:MAG: hypothetical protein OEY56_13375, partial [Cyclobacteriaceae bacterium]|nr:hypothetical protein [Cyclobacteriaceae bacterium]
NSGLTIEGQNQHNYFAEIELNVDNCSFGSFRILAKTESPMITNSFFSQSDISLVMDKIESPFVVGMANIQNNIFASNSYFHLTGFDDFNLTENTFIKNSTIRLDQVVDAALENNHFASGSLSIRNSSLENLVFRDNRSQGPVSMSLSSIRNKIKIHENELDGGFALSEVLLPEFYVDISWNQLKGHKLFIELDTRESGLDSLNQNCIACIPYYGSSASELDNDYGFKKLISTYTGLYRIYKENGDIESANEVYVELQQLYTRRYLHQYTTEGGMNNWFRWKLNQLLEAYIGYGTDPTRALIKSFYILLVFSIFYFFFPSEWDTASKRELLSHFKNAVSTNNNKTKAAIRFIGYLLLSLLNAMTLSLNAFVTLGFGTIPTKGFARYVCIIQGFMGWFLLSLFTVALINQVIF